MATIKEDGIYWVGDKVTGSQFRFLKGHIVPDGIEVKRIRDIPKAKAESAPENKAAPAPADKADKK